VGRESEESQGKVEGRESKREVKGGEMEGEGEYCEWLATVELCQE
jgi:hypothetical protein